jgi:hypothetical protein
MFAQDILDLFKGFGHCGLRTQGGLHDILDHLKGKVIVSVECVG